jgi:hypothetical protein
LITFRCISFFFFSLQIFVIGVLLIQHSVEQTAQSIINNHLPLMSLLRVSTCKRSSSGNYIQKHMSRADSKMRVWIFNLQYFPLKSNTQFAVIVISCMYLPEDDLVEVEISRRDVSVKWLLTPIMHVALKPVC